MNLQARTIAVTGADGFIGSALVAALLAAGATVRAFSGPFHAGSKELPTQAWHSRADITELASLRQAFDGADTLVHLAGPPSVAHSLRHPLEHARAHVLGTAAVLQASQDLGIRRLIYLSSAEVYGQTHGTAPVTEEQPLAPRSPYAACKIGAEQLIRASASCNGLHSIILRPFSIYGPGMTAASLIGMLMGQLAQRHALSVHDWRPVRDYCHLDDLVRAVLQSCDADMPMPLTLNIGSGQGTSVRTLVDTLLSVAGYQLPLQERPADRRAHGSDILYLVADVQRARTALGWAPQISLHDGLLRLMREADGRNTGGATAPALLPASTE